MYRSFRVFVLFSVEFVNMNRTDKEGPSAPQSPRFFKRKLVAQTTVEPANASQGKVVLGEVEEKLKSMRQKRLDRLSMFVAEQSKLSEERSDKKEEASEMEEAIISMKQASEEKKAPLKSVFEESKEKVVSEDKNSVPRTPKLSRKSSSESVDKSKPFQKPSSTKKFISKFNCTNTEVGSSTEDLADDSEYVKSNFIMNDENSKKPPVLNRGSFERDKNKPAGTTSARTENILYNPLLSPIGKQRKGIYLYEREWKFLDNEKLAAAASTFTKYESNSQQNVIRKNTEAPSVEELRKPFLNKPRKLSAEDASLRKPQEKKINELGQTTLDTNIDVVVSKGEVIELKTRNSFENRSDNPRPPLLMKTFKRNSLGDILDGKLENKISFNKASSNESSFVGDKSYSITTKSEVTDQGSGKICKDSKLPAYENVDLQPQKNDMMGNHEKRIQGRKKSNDFPKIPMPLPRKVTNEEKILKKFQRNWDSLNEIIENDSDVDSDELEDLKKTFEEVKTILVDYRTKLKKLEEKSKEEDNNCEVLGAIKEQLKTIEEEIPKFKGLKRDSSYQELSNKLSNCLSDINKVRSAKPGIQSEKHLALKQVEDCLGILEGTVTRNEEILLEVLEAQVASIGTNIFNITRV